jgi:hypothetical protein
VLPAVVGLAVVAMSDDHGDAAGAPLARTHSLLSTAAEAKHKVQGRLFLDVVVGECAPVLELLTGKDEALLVGGDALLVLEEKEAREESVTRWSTPGCARATSCMLSHAMPLSWRPGPRLPLKRQGCRRLLKSPDGT